MPRKTVEVSDPIKGDGPQQIVVTSASAGAAPAMANKTGCTGAINVFSQDAMYPLLTASLERKPVPARLETEAMYAKAGCNDCLPVSLKLLQRY